MDATLEEVSRQCAEQLQRYSDCVNGNPETWESACADLQTELAVCSEKSVKPIMEVKRICSDQLKVYNGCLARNQADPAVCVPEFENFYECADKILARAASDRAAEAARQS
eukprot:comp18633_c0_seq1/m.20235 comp18633_c0_seq1/g.20235  ORF comp18633_c0_seq1/g.20235 comp18633_c0_seq1/m.20235 type:complete len:111 (-) comp18633_c0_seq1:626-958(-)